MFHGIITLKINHTVKKDGTHVKHLICELKCKYFRIYDDCTYDDLYDDCRIAESSQIIIGKKFAVIISVNVCV